MVKKTVEVIKRVYPEVEVYLIGSVAEDKFTARSDIDLLLVFPYKPKFRYLVPVVEALMDEGILPNYPLQFHLGDKEKLKEYRRLGKVIRIG